MAEEKTTVRKSIVCTFCNHAPIRFWGEFTEDNGEYLDDYISGTLWDGRRNFGHHTIDYYVCKSGKRIYYSSYNSYNNHSPRTNRTYLKDSEAIKAYFDEIDRTDEWFRVCGNVDPALIVDSDLL